ncbi:hypothetical protein CYMTET_45491 [Cymbomonas tetramitiformis]|uniref:Uncharacterized protein n=1 Tax=Cymbomonas tetramitiformis TaxID=36881 RepID=A0AAE0BZW5_9CHLO|nr:hypothetical protein CYMTET_45491 [Cymbomonas tetramitiformis]
MISLEVDAGSKVSHAALREQGPRAAEAMRAELLKPGSTFAKQLAQNPTVLQVGDTLFAHAGILPEHGAPFTPNRPRPS